MSNAKVRHRRNRRKRRAPQICTYFRYAWQPQENLPPGEYVARIKSVDVKKGVITIERIP